MKKGFSLLEILVVVSVFAILGILVTSSIILSVSGSRRSESLVGVRENLDYATGVIERQLINANSIPVCSNSATDNVTYVDQDGNSASFSCNAIGSGAGYIASSSAALTNTAINVTKCSFTCVPGVGNNPPTVSMSFEAQDASVSGIQRADVTVNVQVSLRNY